MPRILRNLSGPLLIVGMLLVSSCQSEPVMPTEIQSAPVVEYPDWTYKMKVWPFDILRHTTPDVVIRSRLDSIRNRGANTVLFYIEAEQSYDTFVDEEGWNQILEKIEMLIDHAHKQDLKVICYLNGLEVLTWDARLDEEQPSLARMYPEWLQKDIGGKPLVFYAEHQADWIPLNAEDAWISPFSGWRDLFKERLVDLGAAGLDAVYIDASSLPGTDVFGQYWGSSDEGFADAFEKLYGIEVPAEEDWDSVPWRKFIYFRHEAIRDYLGDLANTARENRITPFFEMSSLDNESGTALGNDIQFTISGGIASSPEIEPQYLEHGFYEAFRGSKAARDANPEFPMLFLGWGMQAKKEFAITLAHSGNYYPTSNTGFPAFAFIDEIQDTILDRRVPYYYAVLIYPMRSKDFTYETGAALAAYHQAFTTLASNHIPFRILLQDTMTSADLAEIDTVVLAGAESMTDKEYAIIQEKHIALVGENGTRDQWFEPEPRAFDNVIPIAEITPDLPFSFTAPPTTYVEYYIDRDDPNHFYFFTFNNERSGEITLSGDTLLTATVHTIDQPAAEQHGETIVIEISDYLHVIDLMW